MENKKEQLLEIENDIISIYKQLMTLETLNQEDGGYYAFLQDQLVKNIDTEELFISKLTRNEKQIMHEKVMNTELVYDSLFNIKNRIDTKLNTILPENDKMADIFKIIIDSIREDFDNVWLSFIEEEIRKNTEYREMFIEYKYAYIYSISSSETREKNIIEDKFKFNNQYLNGSLYSDIHGIDRVVYEQIKSKMCLEIFDSILEKIVLSNKKIDNEQEIILLSINLSKLRAIITIMDNELYNEIINELDDRYVYAFNKLYGTDFLSLLQKDREKYKTLSLKL